MGHKPNMKSAFLILAAFAFISVHVESSPTSDQSWIDAGQVDDLDNDPRLPVACLLVMLHEPTEYAGIQRIKDEAQQYDPELYQAAQELHLMSDEEKMALIESRTEWGKLKSFAKKGFSAAKKYVNKNKGKWMKKAAGMAKGWYNKQGKKVLGGMMNKAAAWAKSKGVPAGLVDKAKAMAAKGADAAVNAGAKRLGAEELPLVGGNWNHEEQWNENEEKFLGNTLAAGLKAVGDVAGCAKNLKACAHTHCPDVFKKLGSMAAGSVTAQVTAICGPAAVQLGLVAPPIAPVVTPLVAAACVKKVTGIINGGVSAASAAFGQKACDAIGI